MWRQFEGGEISRAVSTEINKHVALTISITAHLNNLRTHMYILVNPLPSGDISRVAVCLKMR